MNKQNTLLIRGLKIGVLHTLILITMDFKELYMNFNEEGHKHTLKVLHASLLEMISSNCMEKHLDKYHFNIISQFTSCQ